MVCSIAFLLVLLCFAKSEFLDWEELELDRTIADKYSVVSKITSQQVENNWYFFYYTTGSLIKCDEYEIGEDGDLTLLEEFSYDTTPSILSSAESFSSVYIQARNAIYVGVTLNGKLSMIEFSLENRAFSLTVSTSDQHLCFDYIAPVGSTGVFLYAGSFEASACTRTFTNTPLIYDTTSADFNIGSYIVPTSFPNTYSSNFVYYPGLSAVTFLVDVSLYSLIDFGYETHYSIASPFTHYLHAVGNRRLFILSSSKVAYYDPNKSTTSRMAEVVPNWLSECNGCQLSTAFQIGMINNFFLFLNPTNGDYYRFTYACSPVGIESVIAKDDDDGDAILSNGDCIEITFESSIKWSGTTGEITIHRVSTPEGIVNCDKSAEAINKKLKICLSSVQGSYRYDDEFTLSILSDRLSDPDANCLPTVIDKIPILGDFGKRVGPTLESAEATGSNDSILCNAGDEILLTFSGGITNDFTVNPNNYIKFEDSDTVHQFDISRKGGDPWNKFVLKIGEGSCTLSVGSYIYLLDDKVIDYNLIMKPPISTQIAISGTFGERAGPSVISAIASDPDDLDAVYGVGDIITIQFDEDTNKAVNACFLSFSQSIGTYDLNWSDAKTLILTIKTVSSEAPKLETLKLTLVSNDVCDGLRSIGGTSHPSTSSGVSVTGNWGTLPGPCPLTVEASDPDNSDGVFSIGDVIVVVFNKETNMPAGNQFIILTDGDQAEFDTNWESSINLILTFTSIGNPYNPPKRLQIKGPIKNSSMNSLNSDCDPIAIGGNWGTKAGPYGVSFVASDPTDSDIFLGINDIMTLTFSEETNMSGEFDCLDYFEFSETIATFSCNFENKQKLVFTVKSTTSVEKTDIGIGTLKLFAKTSLKPELVPIRNAKSDSLPIAFSITLTGNWGDRKGPCIKSVVASDPTNEDAKCGQGDIITITFNEPTNKAGAFCNPSCNPNDLFNFQHSGEDIVDFVFAESKFSDATTFIAVISSVSAHPSKCPVIGETVIAIKANSRILNIDLSSHESSSSCVSPPFEGNWGQKASPQLISVEIKDPKNNDAVMSQGDLIIFKFDSAVNFINTLSDSNLSNYFTFSPVLPNFTFTTSIDSTSTTVTVSVISIDDDIKNAVVPTSVTVTGYLVLPEGTTLPADQKCFNIVGNWGTKTGPNIISAIASSGGITDVKFSVGDTIEITFNDNTNMPDSCGFITFFPTLPAVLSCSFRTQILLVVKIIEVHEPIDPYPTIGVLRVQVTDGQLVLKDNNNNCLPSVSETPVLVQGNWGELAGPQIAKFEASPLSDSDIDNYWDTGDTILISFDIPTNKKASSQISASEVELIFTFEPSLPKEFTGKWSNEDSFEIKCTGTQNFSPNEPRVGSTKVSVKASANILNRDETSNPSESTAILTGSFGNAKPGVVASPNSGTTDEDGTLTPSFNIKLNSRPRTTVRVFLSFYPQYGQLLGSTSSLIFSRDNWDVPQTITIKGLDDNYANGNQSYDLLGTVHSTEYEPDYSSLNNVKLISLINLDNDNPGLSITCDDPTCSTSENGEVVVLSFHLTSVPSDDVIIKVYSSNTGEGEIIGCSGGEEESDNLWSFIIEPSAWSIIQTLTIKGVDDALCDGNIGYSILFDVSSNDIKFSFAVPIAFNLINIDNEKERVSYELITTTNKATEDGTQKVKYNLFLGCAPSSAVFVSLEPSVLTLPFSSFYQLSTSSSQLTFNIDDYSVPQVVTFTGVNNDIAEGDVTFQVLLISQSDDLDFKVTNSFEVVLLDDDFPGYSIEIINNEAHEDGSKSIEMNIALTSQPLSSAVFELTFVPDRVAFAGFCVSNSIIMFTPENWKTNCLVKMEYIQDGISYGNEDAEFTITGNENNPGTYARRSQTINSLRLIDMDIAGIKLSPDLLQVDEGTKNKMFLVGLSSLSTQDVKITVTSSDSSALSCLFDTSTVTIRAFSSLMVSLYCDASEDETTGNKLVTISFTTSASSGTYSSKTFPKLFSVIDNDVAGFYTTDPSGNTSEDGKCASFKTRLLTKPSSNEIVTIAVTVSVERKLIISTPTLVFNSNNWNTLQTIEICGDPNGDRCSDSDFTYFVILRSSSTINSSYKDAEKRISLINTDSPPHCDSKRQINMAYSAGVAPVTAEDNSITSSFTLSLSCSPLCPVVVNCVSSSIVAHVTPSSIKFSSANYANKQLFVVEGRFDNLITGDLTYGIACSIDTAETQDHNYIGVSSSILHFTSIDKDTAKIVFVNPNIVLWTLEECGLSSGIAAEFDIVLNSYNSGTVTLTIAVSESDLAYPESDTIIFNPNEFNHVKSVKLVPKMSSPSVDKGLIIYEVIISISSSTDSNYKIGTELSSFVIHKDCNSENEFQIQKSGFVSENGKSSVLYVVLNNQPASNFVLTANSMNVNEVVVSPHQLTFTHDNFATPQYFTLTGVPDDIDDDDAKVEIIVSSGAESLTCTVINENIDHASLTMSRSVVEISELGDEVVVVFKITSKPTHDVNVCVYTTEIFFTISPNCVSFVSSQWKAELPILFHGVRQNNQRSGQHTTVLSVTTSSTDSKYDSLADQNISVVFTFIIFPIIVSYDPHFATITEDDNSRTRIDLVVENLQNDAKVFVGSLEALIVNLDASTGDIKFIAPSHSEGTHELLLVNPDGGYDVASLGIEYTFDCVEVNKYGSDGLCHDCPSNADCPGGNLVLPHKGYWSPSSSSPNIFECRLPEQCLGGPLSTCSTEYTGAFCASCSPGYLRVGVSPTCHECKKSWPYVTYGAYSALTAGVFVLIYNISPTRISLSVWLIVILEIALVSLKSASAHLPFAAKEVFQNVNAVSLEAGDFLRVNCDYFSLEAADTNNSVRRNLMQVHSSLLPSNSNMANSFYFTFVFTIILFICIVFLPLVYGFLIKETKAYVYRTVRHFTLFCVVVYFSLTNKAFQMISCKFYPEIGSHNMHYLSEKCYSGVNLSVIILSYVIIFLFSIGFPAFMLIKIRRNDSELDNLNYWPYFGFYYEFFSKKRAYFGSIILFGVFFLCLFSNVLVLLPGAQFVTELAVLIVLGLLAFFLKPFERISEALLFFVILCVALFGLILNFIGNYPTSPTLLYVFTVILIIAFVVCLVWIAVICFTKKTPPYDQRVIIYETDLGDTRTRSTYEATMNAFDFDKSKKSLGTDTVALDDLNLTRSVRNKPNSPQSHSRGRGQQYETRQSSFRNRNVVVPESTSSSSPSSYSTSSSSSSTSDLDESRPISPSKKQRGKKQTFSNSKLPPSRQKPVQRKHMNEDSDSDISEDEPYKAKRIRKPKQQIQSQSQSAPRRSGYPPQVNRSVARQTSIKPTQQSVPRRQATTKQEALQSQSHNRAQQDQRLQTQKKLARSMLDDYDRSFSSNSDV